MIHGTADLYIIYLQLFVLCSIQNCIIRRICYCCQMFLIFAEVLVQRQIVLYRLKT